MSHSAYMAKPSKLRSFNFGEITALYLEIFEFQTYAA